MNPTNHQLGVGPNYSLTMRPNVKGSTEVGQPELSVEILKNYEGANRAYGKRREDAEIREIEESGTLKLKKHRIESGTEARGETKHCLVSNEGRLSTSKKESEDDPVQLGEQEVEEQIVGHVTREGVSARVETKESSADRSLSARQKQ
ncbi:hypothetical protein QYF36_003091 [Acer negundo]|nr:hypothetical protein QYF36_003091 [Acer negundo]